MAKAHVRRPVQSAVLVATICRDPAQRTFLQLYHILRSDLARWKVADLGIDPSGMGQFDVFVVCFLKRDSINIKIYS